MSRELGIRGQRRETRDQRPETRDQKPGTNDVKPNTQNPKPKADHAACARAWQGLQVAHDRVARRLTSELGRQCGLTISDFDVLLHLRLHQDEEMRMQDLGGVILLSQPALSRLVARLVGRGLVERSPAADDGRAVLLHLTVAGVELADRAIEVHAQLVEEVLTSRLSEREQDSLVRVLSRIAG